MPRSLNEPVGFIPSNLTQTFAPVRAESASAGMQRRAALAERDDRGRVGHVETVRVFAQNSAPLCGISCCAIRSLPNSLLGAFDAQNADHLDDGIAGAEGGHGVGERALRGQVRSDHQGSGGLGGLRATRLSAGCRRPTAPTARRPRPRRRAR